MKKIILPALFLLTLLLGVKNESMATVHNNNNKSQVEASSKQLETTKYNFTLFSLFNYMHRPKADSTIHHGNNAAVYLKKKEQGQ